VHSDVHPERRLGGLQRDDSGRRDGRGEGDRGSGQRGDQGRSGRGNRSRESRENP